MKTIVAFALLAACGFPQPANNSTDAGGDAPPGPPGPTCQLVAIEPSLANTGDTITLEGTFGDSATVNFPGGASASATILGPHRATRHRPRQRDHRRSHGDDRQRDGRPGAVSPSVVRARIAELPASFDDQTARRHARPRPS